MIRSRFTPIEVRGLNCDPAEGMTQQHFKDECDINFLLKNYNDIPVPPPVYADCSQYSDLQSAIDMVRAAADDFAAVPSEIRARFGNSPAAFFDFCNNPDNKELLISLGLAESRNSSLDVTVPTDTKLENFVPEGSEN